MQGVSDHQQVFNLSPLQVGAFLTFAPPVRGYTLHQGSLHKLRRAFGIVLKRLNSNDLSENDENGWTNVLIALPYTVCSFNTKKMSQTSIDAITS